MSAKLAKRMIATGALAGGLLAAGLIAAGYGVARSGPASTGAAPLTAAPARSSAQPIYGFAGPPPRLYAVDPRTLRPRRDRSAAIAGHAFGWSFSPDRSRLAAGSDVTAELRLFDLRRLRVLGDVKLVKPSAPGLVSASTWASRSRVLAVVVSPGCCGLGDTFVNAVDADARRVLWRRDPRGSLQAGASFGRGFVLVRGPKYAIGPSRLLLVAADGRVRTTRLDQIRSGWERTGGGDRSSPISGTQAWPSTRPPGGPSSSRPARRLPTSTCAACWFATTSWPSRSRCSGGCMTGSSLVAELGGDHHRVVAEPRAEERGERVPKVVRGQPLPGESGPVARALERWSRPRPSGAGNT